MSQANISVGLLAALLAAAGCQPGGMSGTSSGGEPLAPCPANSTHQPDGTCACYPNYTECPGDGGPACVQVLLDNGNCGGCGVVCGNGESCLGGTCNCHLTTCITDAGVSACVDPESDPLNCGQCGSPCPASMDCILGSCTDCDAIRNVVWCSTDAGVYCVSGTTEGNCGGCGIQCPPDAYCVAPAGQTATCVCADGGPGTDLELCHGACLDFAHDRYDCGACGNICLYGACAPGDAGTGVCGCDSPFEWCGSTCVDPRDDYGHCGGCTACSPPATECVDGECE